MADAIPSATARRAVDWRVGATVGSMVVVADVKTPVLAVSFAVGDEPSIRLENGISSRMVRTATSPPYAGLVLCLIAIKSAA
jgi:hypothetical protein